MRNLDSAGRSELMRSIRKEDTKPELALRKALHAAGHRFRLHRADLPGTPDVVLPRYRLAIFVHGCFWHQHQACRLAKQPAARPDYWLPKLARNVERDAANLTTLRQLNWEPLVLWECQTKTAGRLQEWIATNLPEAGPLRTSAQ